MHAWPFEMEMWYHHMIVQAIRACNVCVCCHVPLKHFLECNTDALLSLFSHIFSSSRIFSQESQKRFSQFGHYPNRCNFDKCYRSSIQCKVVAYLRQSPMRTFSRFFRMRIGEADNPGPNRVRFCVTNPTAIFKKVSDLLGFQGQVIMASETSATSAVQTCVQREFKQAGFSSFWSPPVISKIPTEDGRPSFRGEALGTAIFTSLPARRARVQIPHELQNSNRFCCNIVRLGSIEVLVVALYGFQKKTAHGIRLNDTLLAYILQVVHDVGLPYIIGGDFNEPVEKLPIFQAFKNDGAVEMFAWYQEHMGCSLPPTCNNVTRNDSMIMHPLIAQRIVNMQVNKSHQIDIHVPLFVDIECYYEHPQTFNWNIPKPWAHIAPPKDLLQQTYEQTKMNLTIPDQFESAKDAEDCLASWSHAVEASVDKAIQIQHADDPVRFPLPCLSNAFKGRCGPQPRTLVQPKTTVKNDRHQGFQPPSEVFSCKNKQKVRQVRRIKSLLRALKSTSQNGCNKTKSSQSAVDSNSTIPDPSAVDSNSTIPDPSAVDFNSTMSSSLTDNQLNNEWQAIRSARGYGNRWDRWILSFDLVPYVPCGIPEYNYLELMGQITEFDCIGSCKHETVQRRANFKSKITIDNQEDYGKLTYRILKAKPNISLDEVPYQVSTNAKLLRSTKGRQQIKLDVYHPIQIGLHLSFGDATIQAIEQDHCVVTFQIIQGVVPSHAKLTIPKIAVTSEEIAREFCNFWTPMWQRDEYNEQFEDTTWVDFMNELESTPIPHMQVPIILDNPELWAKSIKGLKDHKAHGICGWRHEELKAIPYNAVVDLSKIMSKLVRVGFTDTLMSAKTILLAKNAAPKSMHDGRPITILSTLYLLLGKIIFRQVADYWATKLPISISGGLPGRGVKDVAYAQKFQIETYLSKGLQLGGFSLDLVKAFNNFGRFPLASAMKKMGIPSFITDFWVLSLSRMKRFLFHKSSLSEGLSSTTGVPEGCSLSVLAMISLSTVYYFKLQVEGTFPYAYADNWSWFTRTQKAHFKAYIQVLNLVHSLRLQIDFAKSWHWATTKSFREGCNDFQHLFPNEQDKVTIRTSVKDLGERVSYNKSVSLGFIKDKFQEAIQRIRRLSHLPISLQEKMHKAQMAAWSVATYSADTTFVGPRHFHELRQAILHLVVGSKQGASPWLCCLNISSYLHDPLLHVVCNIVRTLGRLGRCQPTLAHDIVEQASAYNGRRPFGPASTFKRYLDIIGWDIDINGTLTGPDHYQCNVFSDSTRDCVSCLRQAWPLFMIQQINRKGIGDFNIHPSITRDVFQSYSNEDQLLLTHNLLGAFQSDKQKAIWADDCTGLCSLCNNEDTKKHRILECPKFEHVRKLHNEAVKILTAIRPEWIHVPCARQHPDVMIHRGLLQHLHNSHLNQPPDVTNMSRVKFYTDGGCRHPTDPMARVASWSVVMENIPNEVHQEYFRNEICKHNSNELLWSPCHTVIGLGLVDGKQTAGRGEMQSFLHAVRVANTLPPHIPSVFTTDAQYVCNIVSQIEQGKYHLGLHRKANPDLVIVLAQLWDENRFTVKKIKSHRHFDETVSSEDFWQVLGNHCADQAATAALKNLPLPLQKQAEDISKFHLKEKKMLKQVFDFLLEINRSRIQLLQVQVPDDTPSSSNLHTSFQHQHINIQPQHAMCEDALKILLDFQPGYYTTFDEDIDPSIFTAMQQGAHLSHALFHWMKLLKWPMETPATYHRPDDWGISWFELTISFIISSQLYFPVRTQGLGSDSLYADYHSPESLIQHPKKRAAYVQTFCLQKLISAIETVSEATLFPKFNKTKCRSLQRLGFSEKHTGIPCRPVFPHQELTMKYVWQYLQSIGHGGYLNKPLDVPITASILPQCDIIEIPPDQRYKNYQKLIKRTKRKT